MEVYCSAIPASMISTMFLTPSAGVTSIVVSQWPVQEPQGEGDDPIEHSASEGAGRQQLPQGCIDGHRVILQGGISRAPQSTRTAAKP